MFQTKNNYASGGSPRDTCTKFGRETPKAHTLKPGSEEFCMFQVHVITQTRKTPRHLKESHPETLHKCVVCRYAAFDGRGFSPLSFAHRFSRAWKKPSFPPNPGPLRNSGKAQMQQKLDLRKLRHDPLCKCSGFNS